jgi:hypothetical protein
MTFSIGWNMLWTDWPFSAIGKNMIFWRKIVIFHTKYPNNFRASLRSAQLFKVRPPPNLKSWIRPWYILNIIIWQQSDSAILNILYRIMKKSLFTVTGNKVYKGNNKITELRTILYKHLSRWHPYTASAPLDLKVTCDTRLILNIIYVWKLKKTVLELDLWAVKFLFFPWRD